MKEFEKIESVCPKCFQEGKIKKISGRIIEEDNKVWIDKNCNEHGSFKDIYFGDVNFYKRWSKYFITGESAPDIKTALFKDTPLYSEHKSQTVLTNLMATNRCNLRCSYCFMNAGAAGYVYEPTLEQIKELMRQARMEKPIGSKAIQITGGEPTVREDLFDIVRMAKELGFSHVQVNTNGLKLADSLDYCRRLKDERVNTIYMSFDGVNKTTNPWIEKNKQAINNLRKVNLKVVLVPVLVGDKNVQEAGKIIRFALDNMDIVRGINFQPISFCGRVTKISDKKRERQRVDYIMMMESIEKEFNNQISRDDFYPVPFVFPISKLIKLLKGETQVEFTAHPGCGGASYIFMDNGKPIPITRFVDVESLINFVDKQSSKKGPLKKLRVAAAFLKNLNKFVYQENAPQGFDLLKLVKDAAIGGSYDSLRGFHYKSLFVGSMWFMDAWNLNIDRLKRCVIHYTTFEGVVPFCSYNGLGYGEQIRKKHSISIKDWEKKTGKKLKEDLRVDVPLT
jgi:uncharacterized radical SAM superfamily Fe-S cluster-containing enzyme